jgi:hypothetical protein
MSQLLFRREFIDAILGGRKTTTLRRWKSRRVKAGTLAFSPNVGWLRIIACEVVQLNDLREADAKADGFPSLAELLHKLSQIYPENGDDGRAWYRVAFRFEKDSPPKLPPLKATPSAKKRRHLKKQPARKALARRIRDELDNRVEQKGSLFSL